MMVKKGPGKEIGRNCLLICVAKTNLNCIKPKTLLVKASFINLCNLSDLRQWHVVDRLSRNVPIWVFFVKKEHRSVYCLFFLFILRQIFNNFHYATSAAQSKKHSGLDCFCLSALDCEHCQMSEVLLISGPMQMSINKYYTGYRCSPRRVKLVEVSKWRLS